MKGAWEDLSAKDLLADVLAREVFISDRLSEIRCGEPYAPCVSHSALRVFEERFGYPDYESSLMNAEQPHRPFISQRQNVGLEELAEQELAAYLSLYATLESMPRAQCLDFDVFRRVTEQTIRPYRRMMQRIARWRESLSTGRE